MDFFSNDIAAPKVHVISKTRLSVERELPRHTMPNFQAVSLVFISCFL